jgi:hypothetical protein
MSGIVYNEDAVRKMNPDPKVNAGVAFLVLQQKAKDEGIYLRNFGDGFFGRLLKRFNVGAITLWNRVFIPEEDWYTRSGYITLRHELVHARDQKKWSPILFGLTYYVLPLPFVFAGRAFWEWRGYRETIRAEFEATGAVRPYTIDRIVRAFCGPAPYAWMFPFPKVVRHLCQSEVRRLQESA